MIKFYFFTILVFSTKLVACDLCGGFMGLTPYDNNSQLSLLHRYRVFNGYRNYQQTSKFFIPGAYKMAHDPSLSSGDSGVLVKNHSSKDFESYKVFELRAKYFLHPRWEINGILPIQQIKIKYDEEKNSTTGVADPSIYTAYHLIKRLSGYEIKQRLMLGAGLKIPLGSFQESNSQNQRLFLLTQNGSGSWDTFYYINYIVSKKRLGLNFNSMFKLNGKNKYNERLANSYNQILTIFARFQIKTIQLFPAISANYEYSKGLLVNNKLVASTNMNSLLVGPSLDVLYKKMVLNCTYQFNTFERVSSQSLSSAGRFVIGLTFNFSQTKYLFKRDN